MTTPDTPVLGGGDKSSVAESELAVHAASPEVGAGLDSKTAYRGWFIEYNPKPIPASCGVDWDFWHPNLDASWEGEEDGYVSNGLCGNAASLDACKTEIDEREVEDAPQA